MIITDPSLIVIYFYKRNGFTDQMFNQIVNKLALTNQEEKNNYKKYVKGNCCVEWIGFYDLEKVRIVFNKKGDYTPSIWTEQKKILKIINDLEKIDETFVGMSIIHTALVEELDEGIQRSIIENGMQNPIISLPNKIEYGRLWQIGELKDNTIEYVFLSPKPLIKKADMEFLLSKDYGIIKIDSHLHKGYNQIGHYEDARDKLMKFARELDIEQRDIVKSLNNLNASLQKERLDTISKKYATFVEMISWTNTIQNTIRINVTGYKDRWNQIEGNDNTILNFHVNIFERIIEQIKYDLIYYSSILNGVQTSLEMLRSVNSADMQKKSLALQGAVAILELVFVFYYSLGIWHFFLTKEEWDKLYSLHKAIVGLGLALTLTMGSHYFFTEKNRNFYRICIGAAVIILFYAFLVSY